MNNKHVKYTSNLKQAQKYSFDTFSEAIGRRVFKYIVVTVAVVVAVIVVGTMVL